MNMYLIKEGFDNLRKQSSKTFSTILVICSSMIILGIFMLILRNVSSNVEVVKNEQGFQAFITDGFEEEDITTMTNELKKIQGINFIDYIDKEEAFKAAEELFKDQSYFIDDLETTKPFPASFVIKVDNLSDSLSIKEQVEKIEGIYKVQYNDATINAVITISNIANTFLLALGVIMAIISLFIISNTIKIAVYSNKREIYIMKYIGATDNFIKIPYIVEGAFMGLISAIISFILVSLLYLIACIRLPQIGTSMGTFGLIGYSNIWYVLLGFFVLLGLFIGIVGSSLATRKHLKV